VGDKVGGIDIVGDMDGKSDGKDDSKTLGPYDVDGTLV
jgi:hypothetical protein